MENDFFYFAEVSYKSVLPIPWGDPFFSDPDEEIEYIRHQTPTRFIHSSDLLNEVRN